MREFVEGFCFGVRETIRGYFLPAVALWKAAVAAARYLSHRKP
ncbi:hypothetical protein LMG23992_02227 [Cupriavidus laharis]|uniref:Uncharacterized protein n=1 Tax=Cupriavidus laharis TaxID=151654 RepID=A0ABM8WXZ9_9BURK|nr:hypothetical protein LMG23992_02227 [Cupriavidus laharis]